MSLASLLIAFSIGIATWIGCQRWAQGGTSSLANLGEKRTLPLVLVVACTWLLLMLTGLPLILNLGICGSLYIFGKPAYKRYLKHRYKESFDSTLAESLTTMASSLRAGLTLKATCEVAAKNCPAPFSSEMADAVKQYKFGKPLGEALCDIRQRIGTPDAQIAFGAIRISEALGGNLPAALNRISQTIRERERVQGKLKALTAQGRSQALILCAAPPLLAVGMYFLDPTKVDMMLQTDVGRIMLGTAVVLELIGIIVTRKVMVLEV